MSKTVLLTAFVFPEKLDWFIDYLNKKFSITKDKVFVFKNLDDESKLIVTFKLKIEAGERLDFKSIFPRVILIHKRDGAFYTINALNKLIDNLNPNSIGNIDYKSTKIDWEQYQDRLILINSGELCIFRLEKVF